MAERYRDSTEVFLTLVHSLTESDLDTADQEGWTPRQVIHHVADSEAHSYARHPLEHAEQIRKQLKTTSSS